MVTKAGLTVVLKKTGPNKFLLVLGRRTGAHCEDCLLDIISQIMFDEEIQMYLTSEIDRDLILKGCQ